MVKELKNIRLETFMNKLAIEDQAKLLTGRIMILAHDTEGDSMAFTLKTHKLCSKYLKQAEFDGIVAGMTRFAWWADGEQQVGTCGTTLKQAIADLEKEMELDDGN